LTYGSFTRTFTWSIPAQKKLEIHQFQKRGRDSYTTLVSKNRINATFRTKRCRISISVIVAPFCNVLGVENAFAIEAATNLALFDLSLIAERAMVQNIKQFFYLIFCHGCISFIV
jgi:hypothetical protein